MIQRQHQDLTGAATGALFSEDLTYRYRLWRRWDVKRPIVNFLMLNPSTADEVKNDPTVERCQRRAMAMGAGELIVTNIFAFRATDPAELMNVEDPVGPDNDVEILKAAKIADVVVCAWGVHGCLCGRQGLVIRDLLLAEIRLHCLGKTKNGHSRHPLYVAYAKKLEEF
jgi:hypothetical protein